MFDFAEQARILLTETRLVTMPDCEFGLPRDRLLIHLLLGMTKRCCASRWRGFLLPLPPLAEAYTGDE